MARQLRIPTDSAEQQKHNFKLNIYICVKKFSQKAWFGKCFRSRVIEDAFFHERFLLSRFYKSSYSLQLLQS